MPDATPRPLAIELTADEAKLAAQIPFSKRRDPRAAPPWAPIGEAMSQLCNSLQDRHIIPEVRLNYFNASDCCIRGHGKSRRQLFERAGTRADAIYRDPSFVKYLKYFIYGPDLPPPVIQAIQEKVPDCNDAIDVAHLARRLTHSYKLDATVAAEEFFKLALECGLDSGDASTIRSTVMKVRKRDV